MIRTPVSSTNGSLYATRNTVVQQSCISEKQSESHSVRDEPTGHNDGSGSSDHYCSNCELKSKLVSVVLADRIMIGLVVK